MAMSSERSSICQGCHYGDQKYTYWYSRSVHIGILGDETYLFVFIPSMSQQLANVSATIIGPENNGN